MKRKKMMIQGPNLHDFLEEFKSISEFMDDKNDIWEDTVEEIIVEDKQISSPKKTDGPTEKIGNTDEMATTIDKNSVGEETPLTLPKTPIIKPTEQKVLPEKPATIVENSAHTSTSEKTVVDDNASATTDINPAEQKIHLEKPATNVENSTHTSSEKTVADDNASATTVINPTEQKGHPVKPATNAEKSVHTSEKSVVDDQASATVEAKTSLVEKSGSPSEMISSENRVDSTAKTVSVKNLVVSEEPVDSVELSNCPTKILTAKKSTKSIETNCNSVLGAENGEFEKRDGILVNDMNNGELIRAFKGLEKVIINQLNEQHEQQITIYIRELKNREDRIEQLNKELQDSKKVQSDKLVSLSKDFQALRAEMKNKDKLLEKLQKEVTETKKLVEKSITNIGSQEKTLNSVKLLSTSAQEKNEEKNEMVVEIKNEIATMRKELADDIKEKLRLTVTDQTPLHNILDKKLEDLKTELLGFKNTVKQMQKEESTPEVLQENSVGNGDLNITDIKEVRKSDSKLSSEQQSSSSGAKDAQKPKILFAGENHPLSNWFHIKEGLPVRFGDHVLLFGSVEEAFKYKCAIEAKDLIAAEKILKTRNGRRAYEIGKDISKSENWDTNAPETMRELLKLKLQNCNDFRRYLIWSKGKDLVENTKHPVWGKGTTNTPGQNLLGKLLEELRDSLPNSDSIENENDGNRRPNGNGDPNYRFNHNMRYDNRFHFQRNFRNTYGQYRGQGNRFNNKFEPYNNFW